MSTSAEKEVPTMGLKESLSDFLSKPEPESPKPPIRWWAWSATVILLTIVGALLYVSWATY